MLTTILLQAATAEGAQGAGWMNMVMLLLIFVIFYFFMIRPQTKRQKEIKKFQDSLENGKTVITQGGIYGRVISLKPETFVIESKSDHSKLTFARWALQQNLTVHDTDVK